ncbi:hypothetical protein ACFVZR_35710 [Streptomyces sp. NPDC058316]
MRCPHAWSGTRTTTVGPYCGVDRNVTLHVRDNELAELTSPHHNQG